MNSSWKLFRIFGIDIKLHYSWFLIFIFLVWSLSTSFFPEVSPNQTNNTYWLMGSVAAFLLFLSVLLHELSHSLVAKARKIKVESITLFFFGGVAGISDEDMQPSAELQMALAGPIFSLLMSGIFYFIFLNNGNFFWTAIASYVYQINLMLGLFNLLPGFPLDGGRALRAILYWYYDDLKKATKIASLGGKFLAGLLIFSGLFALISGMGAGLWFLLLGGFLYFIAGLSYQQVLIKDVLGKVLVKELMKKITALQPEMSMAELVKKYANSEENAFLVQGKASDKESGKRSKSFSGILELQRIDTLTLKAQQLIKLKQLALPLTMIQSVQSKDDGYLAFKKLTEQNLELLPVIEKKKLIGVVSKRALMHRLVWELKYGHILMDRNNRT